MLWKKPENEVDRAKRRIVYQAGVTTVSVLLVVAMIFGLTTAWYSNIIQMNALTVQTETWNFDGSITMAGQSARTAETPVTSAPGDSGVIEFTIENQGEPVNIRVDVKKDMSTNRELAEKMQKRIFCYVEDADGNRTYLNSQSHFIYGPIGTGETWKLTEEEQRQEEQTDPKPLLYWQWVYDVLGCYVLGTVKGKVETKEDGTEETVLDTEETVITEYLMPVEYDLDTATFDAEGNLESVKRVEGETTKTVLLKDYLKELFQAYKPTAEYVTEAEETDDKPATVRIGNYYAIDVNEDGTGVWLCLCNSDEIQRETAIDTGLTAETSAFRLTVTFTGENTPKTTPTGN